MLRTMQLRPLGASAVIGRSASDISKRWSCSSWAASAMAGARLTEVTIAAAGFPSRARMRGGAVTTSISWRGGGMGWVSVRTCARASALGRSGNSHRARWNSRTLRNRRSVVLMAYSPTWTCARWTSNGENASAHGPWEPRGSRASSKSWS